MEIGKDYIIMRQPDDWHAHLRSAELMRRVINHFNVFGRVVCMGNLRNPVGNLDDPVDSLTKTNSYLREIKNLSPKFFPIVGVMLTKNLTLEGLASLTQCLRGRFFLKYLPAGITTNSSLGVPWEELKDYYHILMWAELQRIPILIHAEAGREGSSKRPVNLIDQEAAAVPRVAELARAFPRAIINVEHVSTQRMIGVIMAYPNLSGSISPNHLEHLYRDIFDEKGRTVNVHKYFKPVAKTEKDRKAVRKVALSGESKFFFGSDCAPHWDFDKRLTNKAGAFNALTNLAYLAEFFEQRGALDKRFEDFVSSNGARRYGFPLNTGSIRLERRAWVVPAEYRGLMPDLAGRTMNWQVVE